MIKLLPSPLRNICFSNRLPQPVEMLFYFNLLEEKKRSTICRGREILLSPCSWSTVMPWGPGRARQPSLLEERERDLLCSCLASQGGWSPLEVARLPNGELLTSLIMVHSLLFSPLSCQTLPCFARLNCQLIAAEHGSCCRQADGEEPAMRSALSSRLFPLTVGWCTAPPWLPEAEIAFVPVGNAAADLWASVSLLRLPSQESHQETKVYLISIFLWVFRVASLTMLKLWRGVCEHSPVHKEGAEETCSISVSPFTFPNSFYEGEIPHQGAPFGVGKGSASQPCHPGQPWYHQTLPGWRRGLENQHQTFQI